MAIMAASKYSLKTLLARTFWFFFSLFLDRSNSWSFPFLFRHVMITQTKDCPLVQQFSKIRKFKNNHLLSGDYEGACYRMLQDIVLLLKITTICI